MPPYSGKLFSFAKVFPFPVGIMGISFIEALEEPYRDAMSGNLIISLVLSESSYR